jgi:hypothetical protein
MIFFFNLIIWNIDIHTCLLGSTFLCPHLLCLKINIACVPMSYLIFFLFPKDVEIKKNSYYSKVCLTCVFYIDCTINKGLECNSCYSNNTNIHSIPNTNWYIRFISSIVVLKQTLTHLKYIWRNICNDAKLAKCFM